MAWVHMACFAYHAILPVWAARTEINLINALLAVMGYFSNPNHQALALHLVLPVLCLQLLTLKALVFNSHVCPVVQVIVILVKVMDSAHLVSPVHIYKDKIHTSALPVVLPTILSTLVIFAPPVMPRVMDVPVPRKLSALDVLLPATSSITEVVYPEIV